MLNSMPLSLEFFDIQFKAMHIVWFFFVAAHCGGPITFFVLEKELNAYVFSKTRLKDRFHYDGVSIWHENSQIWMKNMREYSRTFVDAEGESRKLIKDDETAIIFRNIQSGSIYVGSVKEDNQDKPLMYIFYMYPYKDVSSNKHRSR